MSTTPESDRPKIGLSEEMFTRASEKCKASVVGQAACIAADCARMKLNPLDFKDDISQDDNILNSVTKSAQRGHAKLPDARKPSLKPAKVKDIWHSDFKVAQILIGLGPEELDYVANTLYPRYHETEEGRSRKAELNLTEHVMRLMLNHGMIDQIVELRRFSIISQLRGAMDLY